MVVPGMSADPDVKHESDLNDSNASDKSKSSNLSTGSDTITETDSACTKLKKLIKQNSTTDAMKDVYISILEELNRLNENVRTLEKDKHMLMDNLFEAGKVQQKLMDEKITLEKKIFTEKWPNKIRIIVFDVESKYGMNAWDVCKQCSQIHVPKCVYNANTAVFPTQPKEQFIFYRRQRWLHLIYVFGKHPEINRWNIHLETLFQTIHKKEENSLTESEQFLRELNLDEFKYHFCDSVARIFEEGSILAKRQESVEGKIIKLTYFTPPADVFMALLINLNCLIKEDGEVEYQKSAVTPIDKISAFIPKI